MKERFFVLQQGLFTYFEEENSPLPPYGRNKKGSLELKYYILSRENAKELKFSLVPVTGTGEINGNGKEYLLQYDNLISWGEWKAALVEHIAYAKRN